MFSLLFKEFGQPFAHVLTAKVSLSHEIRLDWNSKVISTPTTEPICLLWYSFLFIPSYSTASSLPPDLLAFVRGFLFCSKKTLPDKSNSIIASYFG